MKKKLRIELIRSKIRSLTDLMELIEENLPEDFEDFKNSRILRDAVYKEIESAIEYTLDICNIINSDLSLGMPETEESILNNLKNKKILPEKTIELIIEMKKFRNILVHKYGEIDDEQAFEEIKSSLNDFKRIIKGLEKVI